MAQRLGSQSSVNITHHLEEMHFPASKADLLIHARDNGAGQDTLEALEFFPNGEEFKSLADVLKVLGKADRRRWEDGDKLDPISFMRRYRKER